MAKLLGGLLRDDAGQDLIEYGLLGALIAAAVVSAVVSTGNKLPPLFDKVVAAFNGL